MNQDHLAEKFEANCLRIGEELDAGMQARAEVRRLRALAVLAETSKSAIAKMVLEALALLDSTLKFEDWEGCNGEDIEDRLCEVVRVLKNELATP